MFGVGTTQTVASSDFNGYISNARLVKGTAVYTGNFTPPTAPLIATQSAGTNIAAIPEFVYATWSNGSLTLSTSTVNATASTISKSSGKWYWEVTPTVLGGGNAASLRIGVCNTAGINADLGGSANGWCFLGDGRIFNNSVASTYGTAIGANDVLNVALDIDAGKIWYGKNGTWMASGNPATGANPSQTFTAGQTMYAAVASGIGTPTYVANFGATTFSGTPPTGFVGLRGPATQLLTLQDRGAYNTIGFQDESEYQHVITRNGNVAQGTFSPFSNAGWGNYFDGSGDYLSVPDNAAFAIGTNNFTVEAWVFAPSTAANYAQLCGQRDAAGSSNADVPFGIFKNNTGSELTFSYWNGSAGVTATSTISVFNNSWHHIALVRNGTDLRLYVDGVSSGSLTLSGGFSFSNSTTIFSVGRAGAYDNQYWTGYISNFRFVNGTAVYTEAFTPPTSPLTAITNTSLLTCQSNRFIDNSSNNFTITRNGDTRVVAFSPFKPPAYDPQVHGGSGFFDGTGDWLTPAFSASTTTFSGDFCIEMLVYFNAAPSSKSFGMKLASAGNGSNSGWYFQATTANVFNWSSYGSGPSLTGTSTIAAGQWYHVAVVRSGANFSLFVNGNREATTASGSAAIANTASTALFIGTYSGDAGNTGHQLSGYVSSYRTVIGSSVYNPALTTLTVPSGPLPLINNTSLLLNFTNAGVIDSTGKNVIETVGNAGVVTTTIKKYGSGSLFFDGTGDNLVTPPSIVNSIGTGDFTIEFWCYPTNTTVAYRAIVASENYNSTAGGWSIYQNGTGIEIYLTGGALVTAASQLVASTWQHIALVRSGSASNNCKLYVNGTNVASATNTADWTGQRIFIGDNNYPGTDYFFNGHIDDLRITRGYARYVTGTGDNANKMVFAGTNTLALPTKALPDRGTASTLTTDMAAPSSVEALVVAGGGGGGYGGLSGGGGGAGGLRELIGGNAIAVSGSTNYAISVGAGGVGGTSTVAPGSGLPSTFGSVTAVGGGAGGGFSGANAPGGNGGSGGGGQGNPSNSGAGGKGVYPGSTYLDAARQGYDGGAGSSSGYHGGGGGGAGGAGAAATTTAGAGGVGAQSSITGVATFYAGGGGGGSGSGGGTGGNGGGGNGGAGDPSNGSAGTANTGGGGGGARGGTGVAGAGGSGVVILAYSTSFRPLKASLGLVYTIDTVTRPGYRVYRFTSGSGSISW